METREMFYIPSQIDLKWNDDALNNSDILDQSTIIIFKTEIKICCKMLECKIQKIGIVVVTE